MAQKHSHYEVLQVSRSASPEQIAEAYRKLAKQYHPDWNSDNPTTSEQFKRVTKAYDVLSDPKRRAKYDEKLARRARAANTVPEPPPFQQENTSRTGPPHVEPHAQAEQSPAGDATHQTATQSVSMLRFWIITLKHVLLRLLSVSSKSLGDSRFSFALVVFILAVVAIPASYFVTTFQTPDSEVRSLLARAEVKMQLGDLDEATQLVRKATNIEGANNLSAAKKLLNAIAAQQDAAAKAEAEQIAERKAKEKAEQIAKEKAEQIAKEKAEQIAKEKAEQIAKEKAEQIAKEKAEQIAKEKAEQIAKEKAEQIAKEKAEQIAKAERDADAVEAQRRPKIEEEGNLKQVADEGNDSERTTKVTYHDNGHKRVEVHYKNGKKDGLYTWWHRSGQKFREGHYKNGIKDGLWTEGDSAGKKLFYGHYKDGKLDGFRTSWYRYGYSGKVQPKSDEGHYKNGIKDGLFVRWNRDGQITQQVHYDGGQKTRMYRWHSNGQKESEAHWKDGKPDGSFVGWDDLGKKVYERQFKDGELISEKEF